MKSKPVLRLWAFAVSLLLTVSVLCGCSAQSVKDAERSEFLFDTIISIKLLSQNDAENLLDESFELCKHYNSLFDRYTSGSDIYRINHSGGTPCMVSPETIELLTLALEHSDLSGGRYDVSCGNVTKLWDFVSDTPSLPQSSDLQAALESVDWQSVKIDGNNVTVPAGTELDLGGIAKGYIADQLVGFLESRGVHSAVINLGGNVYALGDKNGQPFRVGIQSPFGEGSIGYVNVSDCSVVTAGSYQRCFELNGTVYHHILDLTDGMPADSGLASVTVICESSAQADALATTCFILGMDEGTKLIDSLDGVEALFIAVDGTVSMTEGARSIATLY